jgi:hypothetical protein
VKCMLVSFTSLVVSPARLSVARARARITHAHARVPTRDVPCLASEKLSKLTETAKGAWSETNLRRCGDGAHWPAAARTASDVANGQPASPMRLRRITAVLDDPADLDRIC